MKQNKPLHQLQADLLNLQRDNQRLAVHYSPMYDAANKKWYILMHAPGSNSGHDCDDAKQEAVAYKKAISWMKKEIKGYEYELKHPQL